VLTQSELKSRFEYHPDGALVRRYGTSGNGNFAGAVIGCQPKTLGNRAHRYTTVKIAGKSYRLHRLIYMYHHGEVPEQLDHINGDLLDNRIENLRPCKAFENASNRKRFKSNTSGFKGVSWNTRNGRWFAYADANKVRTNIGYFDTVEEAAHAAAQTRDNLHGDFARHA
jgi:hypothetical protein